MDKNELNKYQLLLKKLLGAIDLCNETLFKHTELKELKDEISLTYNSSSDKFKDSVWGRRMYKIIQSGDFAWTKMPRAGSGGFFGMNEAKWLPELKEIIADFIEKNDKSIKRLDTEDFWLQSNTHNGDEHIMIGGKKSQEKSHLIVDHETGEIRIDPKDKSPHSMLRGIKTTLTNNSGEKIEITETSINFMQGENTEGDSGENISGRLQRAVLHVKTRLVKKGGRASFDYIRETVDETYSDDFLKKLIDLNPMIFGRCLIKRVGGNKMGITIKVSKSEYGTKDIKK